MVSYLYPELADLANLESQLTLGNPIFASEHLGECRLPGPFHIYVGAGNPNPSPHVVWPVLYPTELSLPSPQGFHDLRSWGSQGKHFTAWAAP